MNVTYWISYSKKKNSTARPSTAGTTVSCTLKEPTSVMEPTIILQGHGSGGSLYCDITYMHIPTFGRRYFVTDVKYSGPNTEISLTCDTLGSFKELITASSQYVERANISGVVPRICDGLNPPTDDIEIVSTNVLDTQLAEFASPSLILGTVSAGGVSYYAMSETRLKDILDDLFSSNFLAQFDNQFYGLRDCLISLKKVPYTPSGTSGTVYIGQYDTQHLGVKVSTSTVYKSNTVLIGRPSDNHANATGYFDFSPYSICTLYLPYVGIVPIDMDILGDTRYLTLEMFLDQQTADLVYLVSTNGKRLGSYTGNCGADMPIASQTYNAMGMMSGALAIAGGIVTDNPAIASAGVLTAVKECSVHSQVNGTLSSFVGGKLGEVAIATVITKVPTSWNYHENNATCGQPVNKTMALSGISGFVKCNNAHLAIPGSDKEHNEIEGLLNSGIFIE